MRGDPEKLIAPLFLKPAHRITAKNKKNKRVFPPPRSLREGMKPRSRHFPVAKKTKNNERDPVMTCKFQHERALFHSGYRWIAGVDEAGRGPLAGPVVAAAVVLPKDFHHEILTDSKKLSALRREQIFEELSSRTDIVWAAAIVSACEIDSLHILKATHHAMRGALQSLPSPLEHVLIDGLPVPDLGHPQTAIVGGDGKSFSIAAASIVAKVIRDRLMLAYDKEFPLYGFAQHKGYGTRRHLENIQKFGPCPIHRRSFAPVMQMSLF